MKIKQVWNELIRVSKLHLFGVNCPFISDVVKSRTRPSYKCECIYSVILLQMLKYSYKKSTSKDLNQFNWKFTRPQAFLTSYCRHAMFWSTFMVNECLN